MQIHADPVPHPCMIQIFLAFGLDFEKSVVIFLVLLRRLLLLV